MSDKSSGDRQLHVKVKTARGRKSSSTKWLQRQLNDPYVQKAKNMGYRSRAAFKLAQIDDKFSILKNDTCVIDLGCAPGGWLQICKERIKNGKIIGLDLQDVDPVTGTSILKFDFLEDEALTMLDKELDGKKVNLVLSDMAAPASGHSGTDHLKIVALCEIAYDFAVNNLAKNGSFVAKILQGGTENELLTTMKQDFQTVKHFKPDASRQDSSEMYVVALGYKGKR